MRFFFLLILTTSLAPLFAQSIPIYNMTNATVDDCKGFLLDSEEGSISGHYDHDEDFTFTICVPGANSITLIFTDFCTEVNYDSLRIFDGPDTLSPQLGPAYQGTTIPPSTSSTTGCITVHFVSDANVSCTGWVAQWTTEIEAPTIPPMSLDSVAPPCSTNVVTVTFDDPVSCDSLVASAFSVSGPAGSTVQSAVPLNCNQGKATQVQLNLSPGLDESGVYDFTFTSYFVDACDSLWLLTTSDTLMVRDCPLLLELTATSDTICVGECTDLFAEVSGGDFLFYVFNWTPFMAPPNAGPHTVCPTTTTTYYLTLSDGGTSPPVSDSITIVVNPIPVMPSNLSICQSDPPFNLTATPPGGIWDGPGIIDPLTGLFEPDSAGGGTHTLTYTDSLGCSNQMLVVITEIDPGPVQAACPGTSPFLMQGFSPPGGAWSGPNINSNGVFTPPAAPGVFTVTYTANGCTATKDIHVDFPTVNIPDTLCQSESAFTLAGSPPGGIWSGPGVVNPTSGYFEPWNANIGNNAITYILQGCNLTDTLHIKEISFSGDNTLCPAQASLSMGPASPPGGVWSSTFGGIIDTLTGLFDPGANGGNNFIDTVSYVADGCESRRVIYVWQTEIDEDSLVFCLDDPILALNYDNVGRSPWDGSWSGPGVTDPDWPGDFDPSVAGPGFHTLIYNANTCRDTMTMIVLPEALYGDTTVCLITPPFIMPHGQTGGNWSGPGIDNTATGLFDPQLAGVGTHTLEYETPAGCWESMEVEVTPLPTLSFLNLSSQYCFKDTLYVLEADPPGGSFSGPGIVGNGFNPVLAGVGGPHIITYVYGTGDCQQSLTSLTNVSPPIAVSLAFETDTLCPGGYLDISASASGGGTGAFQFFWNEGLGNGATHTVVPPRSTDYIVTVSDGCSDPVQDTVRIHVHPNFNVEISSSDPVCYGEDGWAAARINGSSTYDYFWDVDPPQLSDTLFAPTGFNYELTVTDQKTGCAKLEYAEIPRYPYVQAQFLPNPNDQCAVMDNPVIQIVDQSVGGFSGYWDFGDGTQQDYQFGQDVNHTYNAVGQYTIFLYLENEGTCSDTFSTTVCVEPVTSYVWVPNAFTPNGDDINDEFYVQSEGFTDYQLRIYDRWGKIVFESTDPSARWNGTYRGQVVPEGVFTWVVEGLLVANNPLTDYRPAYYRDQGTVTVWR